MSIFVRRICGSTFQIVSGHARLRVMLNEIGQATVTDIETKEVFDVHMVDGEIVVLSSPQKAAAETLAVAAITKASNRAANVCPLCDGGGGWPGPYGRIICKPCNGSGKELPLN